jgi:quinol monooxygenase YgiN
MTGPTGSGTSSQTEEVVIAGWIDYEPGDLDEAMRHFLVVAEKSRDEPGCLDYVFAPDPAVPGRVRVFEHWDCEASLFGHLALPHVHELRQGTAHLRRTGRSLQHLTVAASRPMQSISAATA